MLFVPRRLRAGQLTIEAVEPELVAA
jgi:hypothetical protein